MADNKVCVITGESSGIGLACAKTFSENGYIVYGISRRDIKSEFSVHIAADVTSEDAVKEAFSSVFKAEKHIDIVICCAGMGISGAVEFTPLSEAKRQTDVNFFGTVNTVRAALPYMRENGGGRIICISSVTGVYSIPYQVYYSVSKAAINSFVAGVANEVKQFGISICALMPGDIHTGFTGSRKKITDGDDVYGGRISRSVSVMEKDELNGLEPSAVAHCVLSLALKKRVGPLYTAGFSYKALVFLSRILPKSLINGLIGKLYVK